MLFQYKQRYPYWKESFTVPQAYRSSPRGFLMNYAMHYHIFLDELVTYDWMQTKSFIICYSNHFLCITDLRSSKNSGVENIEDAWVWKSSIRWLRIILSMGKLYWKLFALYSWIFFIVYTANSKLAINRQI